MLNAVSDDAPQAAQIASQNDLFRRALLDPIAALDASRLGINGPKIVTSGVAALGPCFVRAATKAVATYSAFSSDNDPYGQHDFGCITLPDGEGEYHSLYWKIDYYADTGFQWGSEDPADPNQTVRILTIMLSHEY